MGSGPLVGVVVPVYNVEPYLEECLTSIAEQSLDELDVVLVDDGSTDASAEIARAFTERDRRFRLIRQANGGLGRARNVGAAAVGGDYLAFVDSDDVLPGHALSILVATLERTGSDIASGNVLLLTGHELTQSPMHRRPMGTTRLRTHITRDRPLMYDRLAPNKVFRRRFWDEHAFRFPEGVLYEDIPVTIPAHFLASSVDVVSEPVYHWRQRDDGELSITQRRTEVQAVTDRFAAVGAVSRFLEGRTEPGFRACKREYDQVALRSDLRIFLNVLGEADEGFRDRFVELARDFLAHADGAALDGLPAILRLKWHLVGRGLLPELLEVLAYERRGLPLPVTRGLWHHYAKYPFWRDRRLRIPRRVFRLGVELATRTRLHEVTWRRGKLRITGHAYIANIGARFPWSSIRVIGVRDANGGRTRVLPARIRRCRDADESSRDARRSYRWSGFSCTLDPRKLRRDGRYVDGTWLIAAGVYGRGVLRRGALSAAAFGTGAHPPYRYVADGVRVVPLMTRGGTLRIRVETVRARLTGHRVADDALEISGVARGGVPDGAAVTVRRQADTVLGDYPVVRAGVAAEGGFTVRIPLPDLARDTPAHTGAPGRPGGPGAEPDEGFGWQLDLALPDGRPDAGDAVSEPVRLVFDEDVAEGCHPYAGGEVAVHRSRQGYAWVKMRTPRAVVTEAAWLPDGTLVLAGNHPAGSQGAMELVMRSRDRHEERTFAPTCEEGRFRVEMPLSALVTLSGTLPLPSGEWELRTRPAGGTAGLAVMLDRTLLDRPPAETEVAGRRYVFREDRHDLPVVEVRSDLRPGERGAHNQLRTRVRHYRAPRRLLPLRPAVLYDSYTGKQYSDSPRALHEELVRRGADVEHLWVVRDAQVELPDTLRPVRLWGAEWYEAMARSRYIVTNAHLPEWFVRRDGQVVVQTWHGTPLKRIGLDIEDVRFANPRYLEKLAKEVSNWTHLVSPNAFSTPILRRAFGYRGEIIETGYPRNDILSCPDRDILARKVRERLGVPPGKKAVLYAPTWRDDSFYGPGKYRLDLRLDLDRAQAALGDDHVLLIRRHPNVVDTVPHTAGGFVRDVSAYPDVAELFLASDVLLTDYSSLMFDYANTGRPILFFTYDLERYRDELRGFYFDFERQAPGPLLGSSAEVIEALRSIDEVAGGYAASYARFTERFCALDDGKAASRVADRIVQADRGAG